MSTRLTVLEFLVDPLPTGKTNLVRRSLYGTWPNFLSDSGVWPNYSQSVATYTIIRYYTPTESGVHTLQATCDNSFKWSITGGTFTGQQVLSGNWWGNIFSTSQTFVAGTRYKFTWQVTNAGGPAGFAATVTAPAGGNNYNLANNLTVQSAAEGRYQTTLPVDASITAHIWGGGGGGGGNDAFSRGGVGSPGLYNTLSFTASAGDTLEVAVGQRGAGGIGDLPRGPLGGDGGVGRTNIDSNSTLSLNGGKGGRAGLGGASGAGGGGGGASVVILNGTPILIAGGGGGGGGAGIFRAFNPDASIGNNVIGATPSDYRGMNGKNKIGDGGGGGAGGGGYPGGTGGQTNGITLFQNGRGGVTVTGRIQDVPADPGKTGGNLPANSASTGVGTLYYKSGFAGGGSSGGGNGQDGRIILEFEPVGILSTKVSGEWKQVPEIFVKVSGAWKTVSEAQIKVDGSWRKVEDSGRGDIELPTASGNYGTVVRSYSS